MDRKIVKRIPKSRKDHICIECGKVIPKGTVYYHIKQIYRDHDYEPSFGSFEIKQCPKCKYKERRHFTMSVTLILLNGASIRESLLIQFMIIFPEKR